MPGIISPRHSVLLLDKPDGPTSFRAARAAARALGMRKTGHTGTLDSNVTGLLVVAFEEATKGIPLLSGLDKEYVGTMRMARPVAEEDLRRAAEEFRGTIWQTPPERSAVKRVPRQRTVHVFDIGPLRGLEANFHVLAQAGTYVRTLLTDLGRALDVPIEMAALRRTSVGPFRIEEATPLDEVTADALMPLEDALLRLGIPKAGVGEEEAREIRMGRRIPAADRVAGDAGTISLIGPGGVIIALARPEAEGLRPFRVFAP